MSLLLVPSRSTPYGAPRYQKTSEATWIVRRGVLSVYAYLHYLRSSAACGYDSYKRTDAYVHSLDL
jgi:hypothetical protein